MKKNKGSPGIDGVTIAEFESRLDEELSRLTAELDGWTYKPSSVRRVEIPKPGGCGIRLLGMRTVRDRMVQATLRLLLEPIFEPLFSAHSYGFRPERNQGRAVEAAYRVVAGGKPYQELTPRGAHLTLETSIERINRWHVGWSSYFAMT